MSDLPYQVSSATPIMHSWARSCPFISSYKLRGAANLYLNPCGKNPHKFTFTHLCSHDTGSMDSVTKPAVDMATTNSPGRLALSVSYSSTSYYRVIYLQESDSLADGSGFILPILA